MKSLVGDLSEEKKHKRAVGTIKLWIEYLLTMLVLLCIISFMMQGKAAPVIINADSYGSWEDTFKDGEGVETYENITIADGYVSLLFRLNGTNWTKQGVAVPNGDIYDLYFAKAPQVMKDEGIYKMWYGGWNGSNARILYATSQDGTNWMKSSFNPVLDIGDPGDPDDVHVNAARIINENGIYKMWYAGNDGSTDRIIYATSPDGINWMKHDVVLTGQDVIPNTVIRDGIMYKMWYQDYVGGRWRIYYANSTDGINWTKQGIVLDVGSPGQLDDAHVSGAAVIKENEDLYRMWYSGHDGSSGYRIFYAISNNETNWTKQGLALDLGGPGEKDEDGAAYPYVIRDVDGFYKMWYGGIVGLWEQNVMYATCITTHEKIGNLNSVKISLPSGQTWGTLAINKTEPGTENYINIYILDGVTNETILGFENLSGTNIDISSIDYLTYPTIRLFATFKGNGSTTPVLHDWNVAWLDTIPPSIPTGLVVKVIPTGNELNVSWDASTEPDLVGYSLYRSTNGIDFVWIADLSAGEEFYNDEGLTDGVEYYYYVIAFDEVPNDSPSSPQVSNIPADTVPPDAATGLEAIPGSAPDEITLNWNAGTDLDLDGYEIYRGAISGGPYTLIATIGTATSYVDNGLQSEKTYYYVIRVFDEVPNFSSFSSEASATTHDFIPPAIPKGLTITNPLTGYSLILSWNSNPETDLTWYVLKYGTNNISFNWLANFSSETISFVHYGLTVGTTYYYKIAAADGVPNQSPFSDVVKGIPDLDMDNDGIGNKIDDDDDNDGYKDVVEINEGSDPLNPGSIPPDNDRDFIPDSTDPDDDNDDVPDEDDDLPFNPNEVKDSDNDGIGNNADEDDDGDNHPDINDAFPYDDTEWRDLDGDGIGDISDGDKDGDGILNENDKFPTFKMEWEDFDEDGIGDNSDLDDDNDGHLDMNDDYPYDSSKWLKPNELLPYMYVMLVLLVILIAISFLLIVINVMSRKSATIKPLEKPLPQLSRVEIKTEEQAAKETDFENTSKGTRRHISQDKPELGEKLSSQQKKEIMPPPPPPPPE